MKSFWSVLLLLLLAVCAAEAQTITEADGTYTIEGTGYTASVPAGKMMNSIAVNGTEFLETNAAQGAAFFNNGVINGVSKNTREDSSVKCTVEGYGTVTYTFGPDSITITGENTGEKYEDLFMCFNSRLMSVFSGDECLPAFSTLDPGSYKWVLGNSAVTTEGEPKFWGPWAGCELFQFRLAPGVRSSAVIRPAALTFEERKASMFATYPAFAAKSEDGLILDSPTEYQVFQRQTKTAGKLFFSGEITVPFDTVEYRITGTGINGKKYPSSFRTLKADKATGYFSQSVEGYAGGWYTVELRVKKGGEVIASRKLEHIGIGEIFVGAGQSNSTNNGQFPIKQTLGMSSTTDGKVWRINDDPMLGHHDGTRGGSYYPALGDKLYELIGVPIGIASTGHGATAISHWMPGTELYNYMMLRINQLGKNGFRAVLWHQGESDASGDSDKSLADMQVIIQSSTYDAGWFFPWYVAKVSYHSQQNPRWPNIRRAHQLLWNLGIAQQGPDTDILTGDNRDFDGTGIHLSPKGLKAHGEMWAELLAADIKEWEEANP